MVDSNIHNINRKSSNLDNNNLCNKIVDNRISNQETFKDNKEETTLVDNQEETLVDNQEETLVDSSNQVANLDMHRNNFKRVRL